VSSSAEDAARLAYEERSNRELEAGRLPLRAQERLATMAADHAFTSDLTTAEHHAIRGVGFVPVGQVMGASVFQIGYTGGWDCGVRYGGGYGGGGYGTGGFGGRGPMRMGGGGFNSGGFSGAGMGGGYGGALVAQTIEVTPWKRALVNAQQRAVGRMEQEARALGGDGVVAVRFTENRVANGAVEFLVIGTAVRSSGPTHPSRLFTSDLSGQDFARLVHHGYLPTSLLFGLAVMTRHDDWVTRMNNSSWQNVELGGYTQLVNDTRAEGRLALARAAASAGATFAVLSTHYDRVTEHECMLVEGGHDHVMRSTFVGTGVVAVPRRGGPAPDTLTPLPIMRLRDRTEAVVETTR
jgi:hypothetical protein